MHLLTEPYLTAKEHWPSSGQPILAQYTDTQLVVYQAYKPKIAEYAVANQYLGGSAFSYTRMSWIKPNFLWMMFRCGWASKENQERVLALWLDQEHFESILKKAVPSTYDRERYENEAAWKADLSQNDVRMQWDPDHGPGGDKQTRRAIQLGLKGATLEDFAKKAIRRVEDITSFVQEQRNHALEMRLENLLIPKERVYVPKQPGLAERIRCMSIYS